MGYGVRMARSFNTAGPCIPEEHYMLPPGRRLSRVMEIIDAEKYFTLTGGWQIGKTTSARWPGTGLPVEKLTTKKRKRGHRVLWVVGC